MKQKTLCLTTGGLKLSTMKKIILLLFIMMPIILSAQEEVSWDFSVTPGTNEWNSLKTEKQRINVMQIPEVVLNKMSSKALIDACINFPLFGYYSAFNTPQEGFNIMFSRFNIFNKICEKDSIGHYLIKIYKDAGMDGWETMSNKFNNEFWTLKLEYVEYLIAQKEVISKLSHQEKVDLLNIAKAKLIQKKSHKSFNSIPGISPSLLIMSSILNFDNTSSSFIEQKNVQHLLKTGLLSDTETINIILNLTELYFNH